MTILETSPFTPIQPPVVSTNQHTTLLQRTPAYSATTHKTSSAKKQINHRINLENIPKNLETMHTKLKRDMTVIILRIGHRPQRDARVTTHVGLTARALGADGMLLTSKDKNVKESIEKVTQMWGGNFAMEDDVNLKEAVTRWKHDGGKIVHLTMYGINLPDALPTINPEEKLMIIVGAEKVPPHIYQLADWNIAIGNQPHSEIAALAIFLDRLKRKTGTDPLTQECPHTFPLSSTSKRCGEEPDLRSSSRGKCAFCEAERHTKQIVPQAHGKKVIKN